MASHLFFVGSYARDNQSGLHAFGFDADLGAVEPRATYAGIANPSFIVVHPQARCLYAVGELPDGIVRAFGFDAETGALEPINRQPSGGASPCHLALDASGSWLLVSNYNSGTVCVLPVGADGALGAATHLVQHCAEATQPGRHTRPHAHSATFSRDGGSVLVADLGINQILVYAFDAKAGRLAARSHVHSRPGAGPRHLAFHPGGRILYAANELDSTISRYEFDATSGDLCERQSLSTLPPGVPQGGVADIHLAADGKRVYVSNRGHDSIAVFDIAADGSLAPPAIQSCGGRWPRNFALVPGGRFILVANQHSNDVAVLPVLDCDIRLGKVSARVPVPGAACVQFAQP